jgi:hypothetical protein
MSFPHTSSGPINSFNPFLSTVWARELHLRWTACFSELINSWYRVIRILIILRWMYILVRVTKILGFDWCCHFCIIFITVSSVSILSQRRVCLYVVYHGALLLQATLNIRVQVVKAEFIYNFVHMDKLSLLSYRRNLTTLHLVWESRNWKFEFVWIAAFKARAAKICSLF